VIKLYNKNIFLGLPCKVIYALIEGSIKGSLEEKKINQVPCFKTSLHSYVQIQGS
jgi:hypothetical protein